MEGLVLGKRKWEEEEEEEGNKWRRKEAEKYENTKRVAEKRTQWNCENLQNTNDDADSAIYHESKMKEKKFPDKINLFLHDEPEPAIKNIKGIKFFKF